MGNSVEVPQKSKLELPYDPGSPYLGTYPKELKTGFSALFTAAFFTIAKRRKQPKCPSMDEWKKKMQYVCNGIYSTLRRKEICHTVICYNMDETWGQYDK